MRMNAGGAEQVPAGFVEFTAQGQGGFAFCEAGASEHHLRHACRSGAFHHRGWGGGERAVCQIDTDIDKLHENL